jgi:hypothetical protein
MPSARFSAVRKLSASRVSIPSRTTIRSTTTSMLWRNFLSSVRRLLQFVEGAVDLDALEALLAQIQELFLVLALAVADDGGQQIGARALGHRHHAVDHVLHLHAPRSAGRSRGIGRADAGEQQAQV